MEMMTAEFHFREKIPVSILGATGSVGQRFVEMLTRHPWFEIVSIAASDRSVGKVYKEAVSWQLDRPLSDKIADMPVQECDPSISGNLVFSALDPSVAGGIEAAFANAGKFVISNARNHRMNKHVPLLIPEVNSSHLDLLNYQEFSGGKIVTNPNCSTIGLSLALKPLQELFGVEAVFVVTMQAASGAGYPGVASMDILDNVIPYIAGEEEKLETEPLKILGQLIADEVKKAPIKISAQCNRVPVTDGHTECISIKLRKKPSLKEMIEAWSLFSGEPQALKLPTAPEFPIYYLDNPAYPQARRHRDWDKGMAVCIGRLQECSLMDYKFVLLSHNTIRGAAGGAILCAELLVRKGHVFW